MSDEKTLERSLALIHSLYKRTREGKVNWEVSSDRRAFKAEFGAFDVLIRVMPDPDYPDQPDFSLEIIDRGTGSMIESITNATLRPVMDRKTPEGLNPYGVLDQIFGMARRKALKVDDVLQTILEQLEEPEDQV
jgi:hypothetical protein